MSTHCMVSEVLEPSFFDFDFDLCLTKALRALMALRSPPYNPTKLTPFKPVSALPLAAQKIKFSRFDSPKSGDLIQVERRRVGHLCYDHPFASELGCWMELLSSRITRSIWIQGYAPIYLRLEDFEVSLLCLRIKDRFNRPIASARDTWFDVLERYSNDYETLKMSWKSVANFVGKLATIVFRMVMSHTLLFFLSKGGRFASFTQIDDF
ncbi:hypothetical protein ACFX2G_047747 [Malus domestica]